MHTLPRLPFPSRRGRVTKRVAVVNLSVAASLAAGVACHDPASPLDRSPLPSPSAAIEPAAKPIKTAGVRIRSLNLSSMTLVINGANVPYTVSVQNGGDPLNEVLLQGEIIQGSTAKGAGGLNAVCGAGNAVLPTGTCSMDFSVRAVNFTSSAGTLVPGNAKFVLTVYQGFSGTPTPLATRSVPVTLVAGPPIVSGVIMHSFMLVIDGDSVEYTLHLNNPGPPRTNVSLQTTLVQGTGPERSTGTYLVACGSAAGTLPTGNCSMTRKVKAANNASDPALVPGDATFILELLQGGTLLDTWREPVTLASGSP